ncbi:MAG: hypothetical protein CMJ84_15455 [Planctomycetes bacterium]|nr:hypothetical protein [Planctomycetota bacterium]MDP6410594.1 hypothetical protein [Planctomycetota bacterium]
MTAAGHRGPGRARRILRVAGAVLLACTACAAPDRGGLAPAARADPLPPLDWSAIPAAFADLRGVELGASGAPARPGDRLLYRLNLRDGDRARDWLVRCELAEETDRSATLSLTLAGVEHEEASAVWRCSVWVLALDDGRLERTAVDVPEACMRQNLLDVALAFEALDPHAEGFDRRLFGLASTLALFEAWRENEVLAGILREIASPPSLAGAVRFLFDRRYELSPSLYEAERDEVVLAGRTLPVVRVPLTLSMGGSTVMRLVATVAASTPPLSVGMGVLAAHGASSSAADRRVRLELLGGRRAGEPTP